MTKPNKKKEQQAYPEPVPTVIIRDPKKLNEDADKIVDDMLDAIRKKK